MEYYDNYRFTAIKRAKTERTIRAIKRGFARLFSTPRNKQFAFGGVFILLIILYVYTRCTAGEKPFFMLYIIADTFFSGMAFVLLMYLLGRPPQAIKYESAFVRLGFTDALGLPPEVVSIRQNKRTFDLIMINCGKALSEWQDRRAEIETSLGVVVSKIALTRGEMEITITCVPSDVAFTIDETAERFPSQGLELCIGYKAEGSEIIDLNRTAHILIGGATGSGKTVLLRTILVMLIHRGCKVIICDFKGGIDFPEPIWQKAELITTYKELIKSLESVIYELEDRKRLFLLYGAKNIEEYNQRKDTESISHIAVATDEVAEMLDRTGRKSEKESIDKITEMLSTIARLGRAYGIHLILATQRPDANVLPGQIKNNMTYRICGHSDKTLSQIVIDSTDAAEIPSDTAGRFITDSGEEFQARMLSDVFFQ